MPKRRHHHRRRGPFAPLEPDILSGEFVGRKLSELSDEELNRFIRRDAGSQFSEARSSFFVPSSHVFWDHSQYWFARYELERRKPESERDILASLDVREGDNTVVIARKLVDFGWRAASRKLHPDHGGDTATMQRVNAAHDFARERLKSDQDKP